MCARRRSGRSEVQVDGSHSERQQPSLMLGLLRLLQTEWDDVATGRWSWVPYLIVLVVVIGILALTVSRISKKSLNEESY